MFAAKLIPELRRLKLATTPIDSEDIAFTTGPDGFSARLRPKPKPAAPTAPAETAGGPPSGILIAKTTGNPAAKTYTVDIYTGYTSTGTLSTDDRVATGETMITPNLDDTATVDRLPTGTTLAVVSRTFAGDPPTAPRYYPIEHVGLI